MANWYYVRGSERVGPVTEEEISELYRGGELDQESFVWTKSFANWIKIKNVSELSYLNEQVGFNWDSINLDERIIHVMIGPDRGSEEQEYGPYTFSELEKSFKENRINEKTLIFIPGMEKWEFLGSLPVYSKLTPLPPKIDQEEQRNNIRKPFVARMFFHDQKDLYEGVCKDLSKGGVQVHVANFPAQVGDEVSLNVHPENSDYHFTAKGEIVRVLSGNKCFSLKFNDLDGDAIEAIDKYINEY